MALMFFKEGERPSCSGVLSSFERGDRLPQSVLMEYFGVVTYQLAAQYNNTIAEWLRGRRRPFALKVLVSRNVY